MDKPKQIIYEFKLKLIRANLGYYQGLLREVQELQEQRLDEYHNPIPFDPTKNHIAKSINSSFNSESLLTARIHALTKKETKLVQRLSE